jgi:hypothetical protein
VEAPNRRAHPTPDRYAQPMDYGMTIGPERTIERAAQLGG